MYGYNNNQFNSFPVMQNRLAPSFLKGRMVTSIDEAKAAQFDLDGSITFFPSLNEGKVYAKTLDNNGLPVFMQFIIQQDPQPQQNNQNLAVMENLVKRIERIEKELGYDSDRTDASNANK